jgi:acetyl-CoA carboxylase carboxyl transferase subunit alpha
MEIHPLDFEKPIFELQRQLQDLKEHSTEQEVDLDSEIEIIEQKIRRTRKQIYENLTAWQRCQAGWRSSDRTAVWSSATRRDATRRRT